MRRKWSPVNMPVKGFCRSDAPSGGSRAWAGSWALREAPSASCCWPRAHTSQCVSCTVTAPGRGRRRNVVSERCEHGVTCAAPCLGF